jgi:hypothetical protein
MYRKAKGQITGTLDRFINVPAVKGVDDWQGQCRRGRETRRFWRAGRQGASLCPWKLFLTDLNLSTELVRRSLFTHFIYL